ncbi:mutator protein MutT [Tumebacillus sp. BK434]|uniref:NUDIX hydrolase n=1 Tax=Tumebacillus sp. BK434 TaxID=2512169 RepID=UPI0010432498|nr:NUDIX hydrolase [Tumebacillus sp. BK434]TCP53433.1 mutator protein MutT [Tumebacillus sp. BK434]
MQDYVKELRELVGSRPLILAGACAILRDEAGHILMNLRTDNGYWGLPGGMMEIGETLEETAKREVREETALEVESLSLFQVFSGPELYYEYPNGDKVCNVTAAYVVESYTGEMRVNEESSELRFFAPEELPEQITPAIVPILRAYLQR